MIYINQQRRLDALMDMIGTTHPCYHKLKALGHSPTAKDVEKIFGSLDAIAITCLSCGKEVTEAMKIDTGMSCEHHGDYEDIVIILCKECLWKAVSVFDDKGER